MNPPLTTSEIILRLLAAAVAGALIGIERESHGRAAGLRTTLLAGVASAIAMIISELLFNASTGGASGSNWRPDPARLGAGVLTGIGFLGAGTIIRHQNTIRGVTTAASLWFVTILGLAFGSGLFAVGAIGFGLAMITLVVLPAVEKFIPSDWFSTVTVTMELDALTEEQLRQRLKSVGLKVKRMDLDYDLTARQKTISCEVKLHRKNLLNLSAKAIGDLRQVPGVLQVKWS